MPCTTILVGKKASYDGSTIISRNDDGGYDTKKVIVVEPKDQPKKYKSVISHVEIELPKNPLRYTAVPNVSKKDGIWAASGINSKNVGMTATETITSNPRVVGADPYVKYEEKKKRGEKATPGGIGEEDIVSLVLPYIKSAKEGVQRLGSLLEKYGTYEANGIAFNDADEIWWLETIGGHHWIARKVPDDRVVIMPNQFGLDDFDFNDAYSLQKENMCSKDLKEFIEKNHLDLNQNGEENPRLMFGSKQDSDHIYNTPRAWFMARFFMPRVYKWDGDGADYTPESNDIPWSFVPSFKVTIEDIKYLLSSYYQGTKYNPYDKNAECKGKYRTIGVPNSDVSAILQIRGYMPAKMQGVEWLSLGGSVFTACFPVYAGVSKLPKYISGTTKDVSTDYMYWSSRIIGALTDADYADNLIEDERYINKVFDASRKVLCEYDGKFANGKARETDLEEANEKIVGMVQKESLSVLEKVLRNANNHMKSRYHRGDN